jgi:hypothetical protein
MTKLHMIITEASKIRLACCDVCLVQCIAAVDRFRHRFAAVVTAVVVVLSKLVVVIVIVFEVASILRYQAAAAGGGGVLTSSCTVGVFTKTCCHRSRYRPMALTEITRAAYCSLHLHPSTAE